MKNKQIVVNTLRKLALDQIAKAKSGHPGVALGAAPLMLAIYSNAKVEPGNPDWFNRDRVVISAGHASALLYAQLHLWGYKVSLEDLMEFRSVGSYTPGHPEFGVTPGVDASTGALGQGFATAVGMAMAEKHLAARFNKRGFEICDHHTFVLCGDGDLMEGISYEAASLAGTFQLNKLIVLYDSNDITMDNRQSTSYTENTAKRFEACGWRVLRVANANDINRVERAVRKAKQSKDKPTIIICKTTIGFGSVLEGTSKCHGTPFTQSEVAELAQKFGMESEPFIVSDEVQKYCQNLAQKHQKNYQNWQKLIKLYKVNFKKEYAQLFEDTTKPLLTALDKLKFDQPISTRKASGAALNALFKATPNWFGGCADVASSTFAYIVDEPNFSAASPAGVNIPFGVREHAMAAVCNGIALHGGLRTFASTFLVFSDYMKYAMRQSAMMKLPVWYILTHDSIAVGEDGPSHQPVEQLEGLRRMPNLTVVRPADARETVGAYQLAIQNSGPTVFVLSRQNLPVLEQSNAEAVQCGGYVLSQEKAPLRLVLIGSGAEVSLCVQAKEELENQGIGVRVISMPCRELFLKQPAKYRNSVLPREVAARLSVEAGTTNGWHSVVGDQGMAMGVDIFGESGNAESVFEIFGLTVKTIIKTAKKLLK